ncbi:MAG: HNH endonuclease [Chromatiaceae bacterium]|nr:HNH endonuclease [Chromatiaceae bacterium]
MPNDIDQRVRQRAFEFLEKLTIEHGDVLPYWELHEGFGFEGVRVPLLGPQGIFKPKILDFPLSITTSPNSPYSDSFSLDGFLHYKYRGIDPKHRDNVGLRDVMSRSISLVYLHGIAKGRYVAAWPVFIVSDNPSALTFTVAVDEKRKIDTSEHPPIKDDVAAIRRRYATAAVLIRLHQRTFREKVLHAYRHSCALCSLKHDSLLDAAHIIPDSEEAGEPLVSNGLSLCKLHHAAFDQNILGISPDFITEIRLDILHETDGPMLKHGLQEMHGLRISLPRRQEDKPDREALAERYRLFKLA